MKSDEKVCTKCKESKTLTEYPKYYKKSPNKDRLLSCCKKCCATYNAQYRKANAEKGKILGRQYRKANAEKIKQYRKANAEKTSVNGKQYRKANAEKIKIRRRQYRKANAEKIDAKYKQYRLCNPDKINAIARKTASKRRAIKAGIAGVFNDEDWKHILHIYDHQCAYCGISESETCMSIDHIIPISRPGASNWPWNIAPACKRCNSSKGNKLLSEWDRFCETNQNSQKELCV